MYIGDIIGMFVFCMLILLPAGFLARDYLPRFGRWFSARWLAPRYLKAQGIYHRKRTALDSEHE